MKALKTIYPLLIAALILARCNCSPTVAGNGSQTPNSVVGILYQPDGKTPAKGVRVHIRPQKTLADTTGAGLTKRLAVLAATDSVVTDNAGRYAFDTTIDTGTFVIEAASGNNAVLIDSVAVKNKAVTDSVAPDTLKPAGALKGVIYLSEGGDPRKVFVLAFGIDRFAKVNADGSFKFSGLAQAAYDLRLISGLDNYGVLDTMGIEVRSADTTNLDTISLPFTGIPTPKNMKITYDTLKQIVTLSWSKADTALVKGYNVYRRDTDSSFGQTPINGTILVKDTVYKDSSGIQGHSYEYKVVSIDKGDNAGKMSMGATTVIATYFVIDSTYGQAGTLPGQFNYPADIATAPNGDIYVVEIGNNRVQVFGQNMAAKRQIGSTFLKAPYKIAIGKDGTAYVAASDTIFVFDSADVVLEKISAGAFIYDLAIDNNRLFVLTNGDTVSVFSTGGTESAKWQCGEYNSTDWLVVEQANRILLSNHFHDKVISFDTSGIFLSSVDIPPTNSYPGCIAVDTVKSRIFLVCTSSIWGTKLKVLDFSYKLLADYKIPCMEGEPASIALLQNGTIYIALGTTNEILKLHCLLP